MKGDDLKKLRARMQKGEPADGSKMKGSSGSKERGSGYRAEGKFAKIAASFGPTGDAMAVKDVFTEGKKGNYGKAALAAASIVPGVGAIGDAIRGADKAKDAIKAVASASPKVERSVTAYMKKYGRDAAKAADEQIRKHGYNSQPAAREATHTKHWTEVADKIRKRMYQSERD